MEGTARARCPAALYAANCACMHGLLRVGGNSDELLRKNSCLAHLFKRRRRAADQDQQRQQQLEESLLSEQSR